MRVSRLVPLVALGLALACGRAPQVQGARASVTPPPRFDAATTCSACHDGLITALGEDVSFGSAWRASMMAGSARDPYWQAGVRREILDHPTARAAIEDECSKCHMPMAHVNAHAAGGAQAVFAHVPGAGGLPATADPLALDGVSCTACHQIAADRLGERASFTGNFVIRGGPRRPMFGPYEVDRGRAAVMQSAAAAEPTAATHIQRAELCATCHSLYTHALGDKGEVVGELPEQVPYEEWLHSEYRDARSCQDCHMPVVDGPMAITSVLGTPRTPVSRHDFRGANFFVLSLFNADRAALGVAAAPLELAAAAQRVTAFLASSSARVRIARLERVGTRLEAEVEIVNLAGHKLPTAYPSRRAWLRVVVRDGDGRALFASGQLDASGAIAGNDNDTDPARFEPHREVIRAPDEVQIYEAILGDPARRVTTGLLTATQYLKDNRLLPGGFDKHTAPREVAVAGEAREDADFLGGGDRVRYVVELGAARGPFTVDAELLYQPIGFRWAENLRPRDAFETRRFVRLHDAAASRSAALLAGDRAVAR